MKRSTMLSFLLLLAVLSTAGSKLSAFWQGLQPGAESKNGRRTPSVERKASTKQILVHLVKGAANEHKPAKDDSNAEVEAKLSPQVEKFLKWLPVDTETLIVAHDVPLSKPTRSAEGDVREKVSVERSQQLTTSMNYLAKSVALGKFSTLGCGNMLKSGSYVKLLKDVTVPLVVYGGRNYEVVSAFGTYRYEGCSILAFKDELATAGKEYLKALRRDANQIRRMSGHDVFVFPADKNEMESFYKLKPWQGVYVTTVGANVILSATSDAYLEEILHRVDGQADDRALPDTLPQWSYVDSTANTWGLRNIPAIENQKLNGLVWMCQPSHRNTLEVIYLPNAPNNAMKPAKQWFGLQDTKDDATKLPVGGGAIELHDDGTTQVTVQFDKLKDNKWIPIFPIFWLQGYYGTW
ncbi:hypothetical protein CA54_60140 [Symmachiella macrocystis]|uniref:Uncharacterized protein n=1 Tax=Symmachiella macrocystis TaxID=2527985 RepID=A0A5C6AYE3_9PLAN|nr:hypothetical protein [Symmachiella macrocystis]TWU04132.1 hypothetical protein CA54_60140 [Symmachiella macrocystis]